MAGGRFKQVKDNDMKQGDIVKLRNGQLCDVVYETPFGKLLLVERTHTEEPPFTHWHNADGSFYADDVSPLDVVEVIDVVTLPVHGERTMIGGDDNCD